MVKRHTLTIDVVAAARKRIRNLFSNGLPVYLSVSGGKDSIVLADLTLAELKGGTIDPDLLTVIFIDEEAVFDEVERVAFDLRRKFLLAGVRFEWYCIEVRHYNCFNQLINDETFICWDSTKSDVWVRSMPDFAIRHHDLLRPRIDTYQDFLKRRCSGGLQVVGVRTAESFQRLKNFDQKYRNPAGTLFQPIFDWKDADVWRYIRDNDLDFPQTYLDLYELGLPRNRMRLSQFFSIDTAKVLVRLSEHDPDLMERVVRREPNAYLASLYWDTELFRSPGGSGHVQNNGDEEDRDYRRLAIARLNAPDAPDTADYRRIRRLILRHGFYMTEANWKQAYGILSAGDPKHRTSRALTAEIFAARGEAK